MTDLTFSADALVEAVAQRVVELLDERAVLAAQSPEPWIGTAEAAAHVGCSRNRLWQLAAEGAIAHGRDRRSVVWRRSDLDAYLLAHRNGGES